MIDFPKFGAVDVDLKSGWMSIWFNQPETRNALTSLLVSELSNVLHLVRDNRDVRGITLRGRGGFFCSGGDLKSFRDGQISGQTKSDIISNSVKGAELFDLVNSMPQPVIAFIEGAAMAGGFGVACCADVVLSLSDARFAMTETMIGLSPAQISPFVIQKLGYATARRLMLTAARFDGEEAKNLGFVDIVKDRREELEAAELQIRKQVLKCAPGAIADTKALILQQPSMTRSEIVQAAAEKFAARMQSDEGKEGIASFLEKRKPNWTCDP